MGDSFLKCSVSGVVLKLVDEGRHALSPKVRGVARSTRVKTHRLIDVDSTG